MRNCWYCFTKLTNNEDKFCSSECEKKYSLPPCDCENEEIDEMEEHLNAILSGEADD